MMLIFRRTVQFLLIYSAAMVLLWSAKYGLGMSDYLIPAPGEVISYATAHLQEQAGAVLSTMTVAVSGHFLAILLALALGAVARKASLLGNLTKMAAYNLQAYPIVAVAPIIFLFLGDGFASRLTIATVICYFPLLLNFIGIFSSPVEEVEHFYRRTGRMTERLELTIRLLENHEKVITVVTGTGTLSMVGAIVGEFLATSQGIGYLIRKALYQNNLAAILTALLLIGLFSSLYLALLEGGGRKVLSPGR